MSRETLLHQLAARPEPSGVPAARQAPGRTPEPPARPRRTRRVDAAERDLLRVLIKDRGWLDRAVAFGRTLPPKAKR